MRISVRLPQVEPEVHEELHCCAYAGCEGQHFKPHGVKGEQKAVRDLAHEAVKSYRWRCLRCKRTFRVYPRGVSHTQQTSRLKASTVLLYVLGLSYGAVADFLVAMGCAVSKTTVYNNVQAAGQQARRRQRDTVTRSGKRAVIGTDGTYVKVRGEQGLWSRSERLRWNLFTERNGCRRLWPVCGPRAHLSRTTEHVAGRVWARGRLGIFCCLCRRAEICPYRSG